MRISNIVVLFFKINETNFILLISQLFKTIYEGDFMKLLKSMVISLITLFLAGNITFANETKGIDAKEALQKLMDGNKNFVSLKSQHPNQDVERRLELTKGQNPFAVILGCSDSRIPPEIIFDQGFGDLFVIRVAGNIIDDNILGSVEYAVEHLGVQLVMVLGHEKCGAVSATVKGGTDHSHIGCLLKEIQPAVDKAKTRKGDLIDNSIRNNVQLVVNNLKKSEPVLAEFVHEKKLIIVGAYYDLDTGKVDIINY